MWLFHRVEVVHAKSLLHFQETYAVAKQLFISLKLGGARIRLIGVALENLVDSEGSVEQLVLGERETGWREAEAAIDQAIARFGKGSIRPARLVEGEDKDDSQDS